MLEQWPFQAGEEMLTRMHERFTKSGTSKTEWDFLTQCHLTVSTHLLDMV
jgi:hypothetical protein